MSINTYGTTNLSINTVATNVGNSTKSLSGIGSKTYPRYPTSANIPVSSVIKSTSHFQVIVYSSNTAQGTVAITYPFSVSGDGAGAGYFVIYPVYSYITINATSIYPYFRRWATTSGGVSPILTGGTTGGANQPYGTAVSPITYDYNFNTTDAASYTTIYAVFS